MAKSKSLDDLFAQIEARGVEIAMKAMMDAADDAYSQAKTKAESCLKNYYARKPKRYRRTYQLKNAMKAGRSKPRVSGGTVHMSFVLDYNSERLDECADYYSNSKHHQSGDDWISRFTGVPNSEFGLGTPESGWILQNYLSGIHPGWYINKNGQLVDHGWVDDISPDAVLTQFFEKDLHQIITNTIYKNMNTAIANFIKKGGV